MKTTIVKALLWFQFIVYIIAAILVIAGIVAGCHQVYHHGLKGIAAELWNGRGGK